MKNTESIWPFPNAMFLLKKHTSKNIKTTRCFSIKIALLDTILHSHDEFWRAHPYKRTAKTTFNFFENINPSANRLFYEPKHTKLVYALLQCLQNHLFCMKNTESIWSFPNAMLLWKKYTSKNIKTIRCFSFKIAFLYAIVPKSFDFWRAHPYKRTVKNTTRYFENINPSANHLF